MKARYRSLSNIFVSIVIVLIGCYEAIYFSRVLSIAHFISFLHPSSFARLFESNFWQFVFSFTAIIILSRGHLWSYGINSKNLKLSMKYLGWLYIAIITLTGLSFMLGIHFTPVAADMFPLGVKNSITGMLIYWMSAPIANSILFFGFGQTIIAKRFIELKINDRFFLSILIPSLLYVLLSTATQFSGIGVVSWIFAFSIAVISGIMYERTESLIGPMLGQAFFFGFPLFFKISSTFQF